MSSPGRETTTGLPRSCGDGGEWQETLTWDDATESGLLLRWLPAEEKPCPECGLHPHHTESCYHIDCDDDDMRVHGCDGGLTATYKAEQWVNGDIVDHFYSENVQTVFAWLSARRTHMKAR